MFKRDPSGMTLAHDIGLANLQLGVERVEFTDDFRA
jgi:hypothetical protein